MAFMAVAETLRCMKYFYLQSHWRSFSFEIGKLLLIGIALALTLTSKKDDAQDGLSATILGLKIGTIAMLLSFLADEAFFQSLIR